MRIKNWKIRETMIKRISNILDYSELESIEKKLLMSFDSNHLKMNPTYYA